MWGWLASCRAYERRAKGCQRPGSTKTELLSSCKADTVQRFTCNYKQVGVSDKRLHGNHALRRFRTLAVLGGPAAGRHRIRDNAHHGLHVCAGGCDSQGAAHCTKATPWSACTAPAPDALPRLVRRAPSAAASAASAATSARLIRRSASAACASASASAPPARFCQPPSGWALPLAGAIAVFGAASPSDSSASLSSPWQIEVSCMTKGCRKSPLAVWIQTLGDFCCRLKLVMPAWPQDPISTSQQYSD